MYTILLYDGYNERIRRYYDSLSGAIRAGFRAIKDGRAVAFDLMGHDGYLIAGYQVGG